MVDFPPRNHDLSALQLSLRYSTRIQLKFGRLTAVPYRESRPLSNLSIPPSTGKVLDRRGRSDAIVVDKLSCGHCSRLLRPSLRDFGKEFCRPQWGWSKVMAIHLWFRAVSRGRSGGTGLRLKLITIDLNPFYRFHTSIKLVWCGTASVWTEPRLAATSAPGPGWNFGPPCFYFTLIWLMEKQCRRSRPHCLGWRGDRAG